MSGHSDSTECVNCGEQANRYTDWKPMDTLNIECLHCGLYTITEVKQSDLEELNIEREELDLKPLKALPAFRVDEWGYKLQEEE